MLARRAGWFSFRHAYDLGCRVIVVWIGRVVAIPWPHPEKSLTIAEKMMSGEASKVLRREMASSVKRAHAHTVHAHAMASSTCIDRHKE